MTDTGLNLVQRAMQYGAQHVNLGQSAFVEIAEPVARTPLDTGAFVLPGGGGNEDVVQEAPRGGLQVEFNPARCREEKILLPGNMEIETRNELRTIKRRLLLAVNQGAADADYPKTVLITSARPAEGKTFIALNLALTLADERDLHILLIEGDVVNPSLSRYFASGRTREGLTEILNEKVTSPDEVVYHCNGLANLSVMFAGNPDPRASELMASPRMAEVLAHLHRTYRNLFVVIDCSPVISPEAAALAGHVHHTIMVVAAEQASRAEVNDALGHVSACRDVSLVFNKSPRWRKRDNYYQYRYRYAGGTGQGANADFGAG